MILLVAQLSRKGRKIGGFLSRKSKGLRPKCPCLAVVNADQFDICKDDDYSEMSVQYVPKNTKKTDY